MHSQMSRSYNSPSPMKSFRRIPRRHKSSTPINQVEVQGEAYICFAEDSSWFQGNIITNDESNYSIYGEMVQTGRESNDIVFPLSIPCTPQESEDEESEGSRTSGSDKDDSEGSAEVKGPYFKTVLTDHFTGLSHKVPQISLASAHLPKDQNQLSRRGSLFDCLEGQVDFNVANVFKGQKADMVIQRHIGSPTLLGKGCIVYSGRLDMDFSEIIDYGKSWSL